MPRIKANRLPGLELGNDFIYPDYAGGSILNIPSSLAAFWALQTLGQCRCAQRYFHP